jgi:hypothetical protein
MKMCGFDDRIEEFMQRLCDCDYYFDCKWHQRLKAGEPRSEVEEDMHGAYITALYEDYLRSNLGEPEIH